MKLINAIAAAAVIGTSLVAVNPANANQFNECSSMGQVEKQNCLRRLKKASNTSGGNSYKASRTASNNSYCPEGTSYHVIKRGLWLARRTVAEGCFTPYEAAQLNMQADANENARRRGIINNMQRNLQMNRPRTCYGTANTYGYTTYGSATCY